MIRTARLLLRRAAPGDLADLHAVFSDARAMRYWSRPAHTQLAETEATLARLMQALPPEADEFVLEHEGRVIGKAGMWRLAEIGFILHPDYWRGGYMAEALAALIPHLFANHRIDALTAEADPRNTGCLRLLAGFGFTETHRAERTLLWGDEWCDSVYLLCPRATYSSR